MKYSVIIPTYNNGKYLPESLGSALNQTVSPHDVIVVDDGSTDNTPDVIKPYLSDTRIKYIRTENRGVSAARNTGIEMANSELIAFLDADDIWLPNKLEAQLPLFNNPRVGVVYSLRQPFNEHGLIKNYEHVKVFRGDVLRHLMEHNFICLSSAVVKRECFDKAGLFDVRFSHGEDMHLWLRIAAEGYEFEYVSMVLVDRREGGEASRRQNWDKRFYGGKLLFKEFFSNPKYRKIISYKMRRVAWASLWRKQGYYYYEQGKPVQALWFGVASLSFVPINRMAWGIVTKSILPASLGRRLRSQ